MCIIRFITSQNAFNCTDQNVSWRVLESYTGVDRNQKGTNGNVVTQPSRHAGKKMVYLSNA